MLTDLNEIKRRLKLGYVLTTRGEGWLLATPKTWHGFTAVAHVPADLVALLTAQGCIKTELRLVGSAQWVQQ